jgi:putative aldouronate transport system permease protein
VSALRKKPLEIYYHAMLLPGVILLFIFSIIPMFGLIMAFQKYSPVKGFFGSKFVGLYNFETIFFRSPDTMQVVFNTVYIAVAKILLSLVVPVVFALLLNECRVRWFKRSIQTIVYLPNFLSWVIVAAMFSHIFSYTGIVNDLLKSLGQKEAIMFMASNTWFRPIAILTDVWKYFGFNAIVYIAAITGIDPNLHEAGDIDGANRWQKMRFITFPGILPTVILMATLSLGNILNAGFDQIFNMYNPNVYQTGDILDTLVYRIGLQNLQYSLGTAVGLLKSVISMILIILSYRLADKFAGYKIF